MCVCVRVCEIYVSIHLNDITQAIVKDVLSYFWPFLSYNQTLMFLKARHLKWEQELLFPLQIAAEI